MHYDLISILLSKEAKSLILHFNSPTGMESKNQQLETEAWVSMDAVDRWIFRSQHFMQW